MSGIPDAIPQDVWEIADAVHFAAIKAETSADEVNVIARAILAERQRCVELSRRYSVGYEKAIGMYGAADKDSGRGRQEGHINAGRDIADLIETGAPAPKGGE